MESATRLAKEGGQFRVVVSYDVTSILNSTEGESGCGAKPRTEHTPSCKSFDRSTVHHNIKESILDYPQTRSVQFQGLSGGDKSLANGAGKARKNLLDEPLGERVEFFWILMPV
jgi:hypothetical protein